MAWQEHVYEHRHRPDRTNRGAKPGTSGLRKKVSVFQQPHFLDNFSYTDPVDGSASAGQGTRIFLDGGARIVYRLSGTGTEGATLLIYIERHESGDSRQEQDPQRALASLIAVANAVADIESHTGRHAPNVIT